MKLIDTKWEPLDARCLVQIKKPTEKTTGGIVLVQSTVDSEKHRSEEGVLLKRGVNAFMDIEEESRPKIGQKIKFSRYGGAEVAMEEIEEQDDYMIKVLQDNDIYCVKEGE